MLLALMVLLPVFAFAQETEESNVGEVIVREGLAEIEDGPVGENAPFIPEGMLEDVDEGDRAVIGADNRSSVNPSKYPYSAIAYMEVYGKCDCSWTATGFMVDKDWLMTAGHCLVCTQHQQWADRITFYFGYRSRSDYLYRYNSQWTAWTDNTLFAGDNSYKDHDWGYVKLNKNVGDTTGWFGMRYGMADSEYDLEWFNVAGYRNGKIQTSVGHAEAYNSYRVLHYADTEPGYSGCPVFDNEYYAVAINTAHFTDGTANIGRRITSQLYQDMQSNGF